MNDRCEPCIAEENPIPEEENTTESSAPKENFFKGAVGAVLFSLIGGVIWFILDILNFWTGFGGIIAVLCAVKGYAVFAKRESLKGVIFSAVTAYCAVLLAWYSCIAIDFYKIQQTVSVARISNEASATFSDAFRNAYTCLLDFSSGSGYWLSLLAGTLLCALACVLPLKKALGSKK